ncbi:hypothetical protein [Pseudomonas nunensis]|nr:hypothetical protein [Pseudomonas nunensis]MDN3223176.1 hypothetical protein [Pseudomonas nunensis]
MPAKNDDALYLIDRAAWFAGKPRSYKEHVGAACTDLVVFCRALA